MRIEPGADDPTGDGVWRRLQTGRLLLQGHGQRLGRRQDRRGLQPVVDAPVGGGRRQGGGSTIRRGDVVCGGTWTRERK